MALTHLERQPDSIYRSPHPTPNLFYFPGALKQSIINYGELCFDNLHLLTEAQTTQREIDKFKALEFSLDKDKRMFWRGEHVRPTDEKIILTQGFFPPMEALLEAAEEKVLKPVEPYLEGTLFDPRLYRPLRKIYLENLQNAFNFKSNDMLLPFKEWLERMGNTVEFGLTENNTLQTENFLELAERAEKLAGNGQVTMIGISAGGMLNELVAHYLRKKHGRKVVKLLVKAGSPEINEEMLKEFDNLILKPGAAGLVHASAKICMRDDTNRGSDHGLSSLQEYMYNYAGQRDRKDKEMHIPAAPEVVYYTTKDILVPKPHQSFAIEVGGTHAGLLYAPPLQKHVSEHVLSTPILQKNKLYQSALG